jgi:hypothetical protein
VLIAITDKVNKIKCYRSANRHDILVYSNHPTDVVRGANGTRPEYKKLQIQARQNALQWESENRLGTVSINDGRTLLYDLTGECAQWQIVDMLPD